MLDELGWDSAHLFGISLCGAGAQRIALRHPDRFRAAPGRSFDEGDARERAERLTGAGTRDRRAQSRQIGVRWHGPAISAITDPTLVPHGLDDQLTRPSAACAIASRIPDASPVALPGVGHDIPGPVRHRVAAEIRALADHAPGPVGPR